MFILIFLGKKLRHEIILNWWNHMSKHSDIECLFTIPTVIAFTVWGLLHTDGHDKADRWQSNFSQMRLTLQNPLTFRKRTSKRKTLSKPLCTKRQKRGRKLEKICLMRRLTIFTLHHTLFLEKSNKWVRKGM